MKRRPEPRVAITIRLEQLMARLRVPRARTLAGLALVLAAGAVALRPVIGADHRDSAFLTANPASDIADVYSFRSPSDPTRVVLAMTVAGLIPPSEAAAAAFDPNVLYTFKLDTNGDAVEDLVLQAFATGTAGNQRIHLLGPAAPVRTGITTRLLEGAPVASVNASLGANATVATADGISFFAGLRDDPFFFDLGRFQAIVGGQASSFRDPGIDAFAGTSVLALVVELPISRLGGTTTLGVWGTTSRRAN